MTDAFDVAYPPSAEFGAQANAQQSLYREARQDGLAFWANQAMRLSWDAPFTQVLDWSQAPLRSGSSVGGSTWPTTASTAMWKRGTAIG